MGRDKALIPHPKGGYWLTHTVDLCLQLGLEAVVVSSSSSHHALVSKLEGVDCKLDPSPGKGPLAAMLAMFDQDEAQGWLTLPVDMPWLETELLVALIAAWNEQPSLAVVAHDGHTLQPLFGIYPNASLYRDSIKSQISADERSWMKWLERVPYRTLGFQAEFLRNANCPADLAPFGT